MTGREATAAVPVARRLEARELLVLGAGLLAAGAPALAAPWVGEAMEALVPQVDRAAPFFSGLRPALLYLAMPLVVLSSFVLVLSPGLLAALALDRAPSPARWVLNGFLLSLFGLAAMLMLLQAIGASPEGPGFVALVVFLQLALLAWLWLRLQGRPGPSSPLSGGHAAFWACLGVLTLVGVIGLTPKLFWQAFTDDGLQMRYVASLLLDQPVPFSPADSGPNSNYPGVNMMLTAYPVSWFVRLFGDVDSAARIPFLLFLAVLQAGVVAFAERVRPLDAGAQALIALGVAGFALVMSFSATYDPYTADVALPATQDTLLIALFLAGVTAQLEGEHLLEGLACLGMLLCSPNGLPLAAGWLATRAFLTHPAAWLALAPGLGVLVACVLVTWLVPWLVGIAGLPTPGGEHEAGRLLQRFSHIEPLDLRRLLFLFVPCGIYPVLAWKDLRTSQLPAQAMLLTSLGIFALYYPLASLSLHYFAPAMLLPLAAFWAAGAPGDWRQRARPRLPLAVLAVLALWLNLPTGAALYDVTREIGQRIDVSGASGFAENQPRAHRASMALRLLFPGDGFLGVPEERLGLSALAMRHYAERAPSGPKDYALVDPGGAAPDGFFEVGATADATVHAASQETWERDRRLRPDTSLGRGFYLFSRDHLFTGRVGRVGRGEGWVISIPWWLEQRPALAWSALLLAALGAAATGLALRVWLLRGQQRP